MKFIQPQSCFLTRLDGDNVYIGRLAVVSANMLTGYSTGGFTGKTDRQIAVYLHKMCLVLPHNEVRTNSL